MYANSTCRIIARLHQSYAQYNCIDPSISVFSHARNTPETILSADSKCNPKHDKYDMHIVTVYGSIK